MIYDWFSYFISNYNKTIWLLCVFYEFGLHMKITFKIGMPFALLDIVRSSGMTLTTWSYHANFSLLDDIEQRASFWVK